MAGRSVVLVAAGLASLGTLAACRDGGGASSSRSTAAGGGSASSVVAVPTTTALVAPSGFATVAGRVTAADGSTCDVCLWAALTAGQQEQGLMGVTDLSGADGMVFRFGGETTAQFWMADTPLPLSIAFFGRDGSFVSSTDMAPCVDGPTADCARYAAAGPYTDAVEVGVGKLPSLLMTPGSHLELFDRPCPLQH